MDFNVIWNKQKTHLFNYIKGKANSINEAEDILQEVAVKFHLALRKQAIKNHKLWLFQVARNTIADFYRNKTQTPIAPNSEIPETKDHDSSTACVCDLAGFVIQHYLPEKYGQPLFMSDIEAIPQKEIAKKLNLSLTATKTRIQRARKQLRERVKNCVDISYGQDGSIGDFNLKNDCQLPQELLQEMDRLKLLP